MFVRPSRTSSRSLDTRACERSNPVVRIAPATMSKPVRRRSPLLRPGASAAAAFTRTPVDLNLAGQSVFAVALRGIDDPLSVRSIDACDPVGRVLDLEFVLGTVELDLHLLLLRNVVEALRGEESGSGGNRNLHLAVMMVVMVFPVFGVVVFSAHRVLLARLRRGSHGTHNNWPLINVSMAVYRPGSIAKLASNA